MANNRQLSRQPFEGKTAVISGGSKGIGKETAKEIVRLGGSVCVISRGAEALEKAISEIESLCVREDQFIESFTCDTTDHDALEPLLKEFVERRGTPDYLINVVGYAYPEYIEKLSFEDFKKNMDINYYGQVVPLIILLPYFIKAQKGHVSFVSSMAGFMGIIGYASYSPSKYALVGLAEVLRHEMKPYNISVSVLYPPDTDTPGFEIENQTKPPETAILSETAKLFTAEQVAEAYVQGIMKKKFHIVIGEGRWIWPLSRFFPRLVHMIIDQDLNKARKKLGK
jgi:3-dehydrosphinganine reductase